MKQFLCVGERYALSNRKSRYLTIRYISLLAVLTSMCLYAPAQRPDNSGPVLSGIVTDTAGAPIQGATVALKGTSAKIITNREGQFTLQAARQSGILVISFLGYETAEERFNEGSTGPYQFILVPMENVLEEVEVNTGYQAISKERFVGSAVVLDSAAFHRRSGAGILERLDGTVVGLLFDKKIDQSNNFQIRGISTLGGYPMQDANLQRPLIVVDNFPFEGELDALNQYDVVSVSVLKDAAATSIWGAKAGNGVVVITTRSGAFNQPMCMDFHSNFGLMEKRDLYYYPRMSTEEFIDIEKFLFEKGYFETNINNSAYPYNWPVVSPVVELLNDAETGVITEDEAVSSINKLAKVDVRDQLNKYWYREVFGQRYHLSVNGGGNRYAYQVSTGYNYALPDVQYSKGKQEFTLTVGNTFTPVKGVRVELDINYSKSTDRNAGYHLPGTIYPYMQLADDMGLASAVPHTYRMSYVDTVGNGALLDWHFRPLEEVRLADNRQNRRYLRLNAGISYDLTDWLQASVRYQTTTDTREDRRHFSVDTWEARDLINRFTNLSESNANLRNPIPLGGILRLGAGEQNNQYLRAQLRVNKEWDGVHEVTMLLGAETSESTSTGNDNQLYGYNDEYGTYRTGMDYQSRFPLIYSQYVNSTIPQGVSYRVGLTDRTVSFLGNASYTYNNRYTVFASARRDGSNLFGVATNNKWKPLWSLGASWDVSQESFSLPHFLNKLRVRASYGYTGNVNNSLSGYATMRYQPISPTGLNNLPWGQLITPPNPNLRWEQVAMLNVAVDFGMFNNRVAGGIDLFHKKSTDLISVVPFDPTTGVAQYSVNSASMEGNGFEVTLNTKNTRGVLQWDTGLGISYAKMVVTKIYDGGFRASDFIGYGLQPAEGKVAYGISSYRWAGLDPETGDPRGYINGEVTKNYMGIFNDSVSNQVFHGSSIPLYSGFIHNALRWRAFSLSANITYRLGFHFRQPALQYNSVFTAGALHADYAMRWQQPGDEMHTTVPSMLYPVPTDVAQRDQFYAGAEIHVKKGDNIRLQDLRISWGVPKKGIDRYGLRKLEVFLYANNLNVILWKAYSGRLDSDYSGASIAASPVPRSWTAGVNIGF